MIPLTEIDCLIESGLREIRLANDGNLTFGYRLRLRRLLMASYVDDRYATLCFYSARTLLPGWNKLQIERIYKQLPSQLLSICCESVLKLQPTKDLLDKLLHFYSYLDDIPFANDPVYPPSYAHFAAYSAAAVALNYPSIEVFQEKDTEYDLDPDMLDTHTFVAMDCAGALWDPNSSPEKRRTYWKDFLTQDVPIVLTETSICKLICEDIIYS